MRNIIKSAIFFAGTLACVLPVSADKLVILHTNDTHSMIDPDDKDNLGGVARRKVIVDSVRAAEEHVLLIDAGDAVQGTLYFNLFGGELEQKLMNALDYDLRILGNHEFDNGVDSLAAVLRHADSKFLATNYDLSESPLADMFSKYDIRNYDGRKIGFIAINLEPAGMIAEGNYDGVKYLDAIESANSAAWWLKNIEGVDAVVAITHVGYDPTTPPGDVDIAKNSSDIDVIIGGHSHDLIKPGDEEMPYRVKNRQGRDILVTQVGKSGKNIGKVAIDLENLTADYTTIPVDSRLDSRVTPEIPDLIRPYRQGVDSLMNHAIAKTAVELPQSSPALLNFCTDAVLDMGNQLAKGIDFAILNKGGIRRGLPKGNITEGQIITMLPFDNRIEVMDIKGKDLMPTFTQMARTDGNGVSRGVEIVYSPKTATSDAEVKSVVINGKPIDPEKTYRVATIDYLANGGDYMTSLTNHTTVAKSTDTLYKDLLKYIKSTYKKRKINPDDSVRMHP